MKKMMVDIYGHLEECLILKIYSYGAMDVERVRDGKCFRVSGIDTRGMV